MKKLQTLNANDLKVKNWLWITNKYSYLLHLPKEQAENKLLDDNWRLATDEEIVKDYIISHNLDWKVQIYVPDYNNFVRMQGYTHFANQLEQGLLPMGIEWNYTMKENTDLILVINSVWTGANTGRIQELKKLGGKYNIPVGMFTMWESDQWKLAHFEEMMFCDFLIVPNKWNKQTLIKQGYKKPIYICPLPNDDQYVYQERPETRDKFVFLHYNACDYRKGFPEYYEAFLEEFTPDEPVKFIQKSRENDSANVNFNPYLNSLDQHPHFKWVRENLNTQQMIALHRGSDCFVFPSKGEGWGYPPVEALLTGNPVIVTKKHGHKEWFNDACLEVKTTMEPATFSILGEIQEETGNWYKPDKEHLKKQMRFIFEEWKREGRNAQIFQNAKKQSQLLKNKFNKKAVADIFVKILAKEKIISFD